MLSGWIKDFADNNITIFNNFNKTGNPKKRKTCAVLKFSWERNTSYG